MIKFKAIAFPLPSLGLDLSKEKKLVVPDQSMSLEEILARFTRGEALPVGNEVQYGTENDDPLNVDLEKLANSDLVDKAEHIEKLKQVSIDYESQQKLQAEKRQADQNEAAKKRESIRIKKLAKKMAEDNSDKKA